MTTEMERNKTAG